MAKLINAAILAIITSAILFLAYALAVELGITSIPLGSGSVLELTADSSRPIRIALILAAIAGMLFWIGRVRRRS